MVDPESYVDINAFIYWLGNHPSFGKTACQWIKKIEKSARRKYVTSTLTIYQTLIIIAGLTGKNLKNQELVEEIVNSVKNLPGLTITPLTVEDVTQAAKLMKEYDLDYEDALHLATALRNKAREIVSNDKDFDRTPLKRKFE
ncbi:MAG: type II toxin-antitoxin system VapC family toxin [Candidatus Nezhaarchaeales archaeon]